MTTTGFNPGTVHCDAQGHAHEILKVTAHTVLIRRIQPHPAGGTWADTVRRRTKPDELDPTHTAYTDHGTWRDIDLHPKDDDPNWNHWYGPHGIHPDA